MNGSPARSCGRTWLRAAQSWRPAGRHRSRPGHGHRGLVVAFARRRAVRRLRVHRLAAPGPGFAVAGTVGAFAGPGPAAQGDLPHGGRLEDFQGWSKGWWLPWHQQRRDGRRAEFTSVRPPSTSPCRGVRAPGSYALGPDLLQDMVADDRPDDLIVHDPRVFYPLPPEDFQNTGSAPAPASGWTRFCRPRRGWCIGMRRCAPNPASR